MNPHTFILIGRSGCGKGTQGKLLSEYLEKKDPTRKVLYIQTGGELREFVKGTTHTQKTAEEIYKRGGLQPEFLTIYMWVNVLINKFSGNENIIIDGTPRKVHEAGVLSSVFDFYAFEKPTVLYIDVSKDWSVDKLMARGRRDDTREDIAVRLSWFETEVMPTIEFYRTNPKYNFFQIQGERPIEEVHADIIRSIESK